MSANTIQGSLFYNFKDAKKLRKESSPFIDILVYGTITAVSFFSYSEMQEFHDNIKYSLSNNSMELSKDKANREKVRNINVDGHRIIESGIIDNAAHATLDLTKKNTDESEVLNMEKLREIDKKIYDIGEKSFKIQLEMQEKIGEIKTADARRDSKIDTILEKIDNIPNEINTKIMENEVSKNEKMKDRYIAPLTIVIITGLSSVVGGLIVSAIMYFFTK